MPSLQKLQASLDQVDRQLAAAPYHQKASLEGQRQSLLSAINKAQQMEANRPVYPTIKSWLETGPGGPQLKKGLAIGDRFTPETTGYDAYKNYALAAPGESVWEKLQMQGADRALMDARNQTAKSSATGQESAFSQLARSGGLSKGARERLARGSQLDLALANQNLINEDAKRRLGISTQAEQNRIGALGNFGTLEANKNVFGSRIAESDINRIMKQKALEDQAKLGRYSEEMKSWAAERQAQATENSGKK